MTKRYMMSKRLYLRKAGAGVEYVDDEIVKTGQLLTLTNVAVEDETSALDYVRIGKVTAGYFHIWEEQKSPAAGELVFTTEEHSIREEEHFRCEVKGGAANDVIRVYLEGYWQYWKE